MSEIWSNGRVNIRVCSTVSLLWLLYSSFQGQTISPMSHQFQDKFDILVVDLIPGKVYDCTFPSEMKHIWCLSFAGIGATAAVLIRSEQVSQKQLCSPDQFRGPTNLWVQNRNEKIPLLEGKKNYIGKTHTIDTNICNLMHDCLLPLCWQRYRRGLNKAVHVFGYMSGQFNSS